MSPPERPVVVYDGRCRFCRFAVFVLATLDRRQRLALVDHPSTASDELARAHPRAPLGEVLVLLDDVAIRTGGAAVAGIAATCWPAIGGALRSGALAELLARGYRLVARERGLLSHLVPDVAPVRR